MSVNIKIAIVSLIIGIALLGVVRVYIGQPLNDSYFWFWVSGLFVGTANGIVSPKYWDRMGGKK